MRLHRLSEPIRLLIAILLGAILFLLLWRIDLLVLGFDVRSPMGMQMAGVYAYSMGNILWRIYRTYHERK
jgi:hypothetical protein